MYGTGTAATVTAGANGDPKTKLTTHSYNQVGYKCLRLSHLFPLEDNRT